jgi:hypothetical protein
MELDSTVARVDLSDRPNGTAFLVNREHAVTALHVLDGYTAVRLFFSQWPRDNHRDAVRCWRHPGGQDVAVLKLDRPAPGEINPLPRGDLPKAEDKWYSFGFPNGNPHPFVAEKVEHPALRFTGLNGSFIQLNTAKAQEGLGGLSGAPCVVGGRIVGLVSFQLQRFSEPESDRAGEDNPRSLLQVSHPSLQTLYALPISLLDLYPEVSLKSIPIQVAPLEQGAIAIDSPCYVARKCDTTAVAALEGGPRALLKLFGPAKMGKTSLLVRLESHMKSREVPAVYIDLAEVSSGAETTAELFARMGEEILRGIGAGESHADAIRRSGSPMRIFRDVIADRVLSPGRALFLAIDNVDVLARRPSVFSDLQSAIRSWHERGSRDEVWKRLRLVLACRTSMELYLDPTIGSPLGDAGLPIELPDFAEYQTLELLRIHGLDKEYLQPIGAIVGGSPYMVRQLIYEITESRTPPDPDPLRKLAGRNESRVCHHVEWMFHQLDERSKAALRTVVTSKECRDFADRKRLGGTGLVRLGRSPDAEPRYPIIESVLGPYL